MNYTVSPRKTLETTHAFYLGPDIQRRVVDLSDSLDSSRLNIASFSRKAAAMDSKLSSLQTKVGTIASTFCDDRSDLVAEIAQEVIKSLNEICYETGGNASDVGSDGPYHDASQIISLDTTILVPPCLEQLLTLSFFTICQSHGDASRKPCNMFCMDCGGDALCIHCQSSKHKKHEVIQIRRAFYQDVVNVSEIKKFMDISRVQVCKVNNVLALYLKRPQQKAGFKGRRRFCEICSRGIAAPYQFCSLYCKLVRTKRNRAESFTSEARNGEDIGNGREGMITSSERREAMEQVEMREDSEQQMYLDSPPRPPECTRTRKQHPKSTRRRKSIPHRAPFW